MEVLFQVLFLGPERALSLLETPLRGALRWNINSPAYYMHKVRLPPSPGASKIAFVHCLERPFHPETKGKNTTKSQSNARKEIMGSSKTYRAQFQVNGFQKSFKSRL